MPTPKPGEKPDEHRCRLRSAEVRLYPADTGQIGKIHAEARCESPAWTPVDLPRPADAGAHPWCETFQNFVHFCYAAPGSATVVLGVMYVECPGPNCPTTNVKTELTGNDKEDGDVNVMDVEPQLHTSHNRLWVDWKDSPNYAAYLVWNPAKGGWSGWDPQEEVWTDVKTLVKITTTLDDARKTIAGQVLPSAPPIAA